MGPSAAERRAELHAVQGGCCFYCVAPVRLRRPGAAALPGDATVDHFVPRALGGADHHRNWVLACAGCNQRKGHALPGLAEMLRWNMLAAEWPRIRPVDLALFESRRCVVCAGWIHPMRLEASLRSGRATQTCRRGCDGLLPGQGGSW
ncbi:hypothetical protein D1Y84_12610 [Acidipila sp. EB88]|nr:hypothetical protein D1Y84_12610 [Acidipila sp. EB88]